MRIEEITENAPFDTTHKWLREYNSTFVTNKFTPIRLLAYDDDGEVIGSLDGQIFWGKMHIDNLIVSSRIRKGGTGSLLMKRAEEIAVGHCCTGIYLDTMSFQALDFYKKMGYCQAGLIEGFENQSTQYFLHKVIQQSHAPDSNSAGLHQAPVMRGVKHKNK